MFNLTINPIANTNVNTNIVVSGTYAWQPSLQVAIDSGSLVGLPSGNSQPAMSGTWGYTNAPLSAGQHQITIKDPDSGLVVSQNVNILVPPPVPPTVSISSNPSSFITGNSSVLTWTSVNAASAMINQGIGNVAVSGTVTVKPIANTTYTVTVTGPGGVATGATTVTVLPVPPPQANVVYIQKGSGSFTIAGNVYTLDINGNCIENGKPIPGGGGTSQMAGYNNTVYGQDASSKTWWIWNQSSWNGPVTAPPPAVPLPPPPNTESNSNTVVTTTSGTIYDAQLNAWTLVNLTSFPFLVANNGVADTRTSNVTALLYFNHTVYQENKSNNWYFEMSNGNWNGPVSDPRLAPPPPPSTGNFSVLKNQSIIVDPNGNKWFGKGVDVAPWGRPIYKAVTPPGTGPLTTAFPGINALGIYIANDEGFTVDTGLFPIIDALTASGIVVMLHSCNSGYTNSVPNNGDGSLTAECNMFSGYATHYLANPYVWYVTSNEPSDASGQPGSVAIEQLAVYNAVRNTGNKSMVGMNVTGATLPPANYAQMTNVYWECHLYPWLGQGQALYDTVNNDYGHFANYVSKDGTMPVFIGECGSSTTGGEPNDGPWLPGQLMAVAPWTTVSTSMTLNGWTFWGIASDGTEDQMFPNNGTSGTLTAYGAQIAAGILA
jgi:hypothetical protein